MTSQVIPFPLIPTRPEGRPLLPAEAERIARFLLTVPRRQYDGITNRFGLSRIEKIEVGISLHFIEQERRKADRRTSAEVIRILDSDERLLWKMVQALRPEQTLRQFLAKRDEYVAGLRGAEEAADRRKSQRRAAQSTAPPKPAKAKRQARERLPSQERN